MIFSDKFICATEEYSTFEKFVPAPYFRKEIFIENDLRRVEITLCGLGFYRLWINGNEITKGLLAPYVSNPDDIKYYDNYNITDLLLNGKNAVCVMLGNGMLNNPGGEIWDFEKAAFRRSPCLAFAVELITANGKRMLTEADESVLCTESPLYFDDFRCGERYDATKQITDWNLPDFDASGWRHALKCKAPKGKAKQACVNPVKPTGEVIKPVCIVKGKVSPKYDIHKKVSYITPCEKSDMRDGFIYDFGINTSGVPLLKIKGQKGQRVELQFGEYLDCDGNLSYNNINFYPDEYAQRDVFICSGGNDVFMPYFTYHGFRYCIVMGIDEALATDELLSVCVCHSALEDTASFSCSDKKAEQLYNMCRNSDLSNFFYFPTDCPHREKNGWTGDVAVSSEHMLMMYNCEKEFCEWLQNASRAQHDNGEFPAIIPTGGWGMGHGPSWDAFAACVMYYTYRYKGNIDILRDNSDMLYKYILWAKSTRDEKGLVRRGLGDWCPVGGNGKIKASPEFTSNVSFADTCKKAEFIYGVAGEKEKEAFCRKLYEEIRNCIRKEFIDTPNCTADSVCMTSQAMAVFYDIFDENEKEIAVKKLVELIHANNDFSDCGILGARVIYHVLSKYGYGELAYKMITRPEYPSYGHFIEQGLTALPESFFENFNECDSLNHHFFGDISNWFISDVVGIKYNVEANDLRKATVEPDFIAQLDWAHAALKTPCGKIDVLWERKNGNIKLKVDADDRIDITVRVNNTEIGHTKGEYDICL